MILLTMVNLKLLPAHPNSLGDPLKVAFHSVQRLWGDLLKLPVHLLILHQSPVTSGPQAPRITVYNVSQQDLS